MSDAVEKAREIVKGMNREWGTYENDYQDAVQSISEALTQARQEGFEEGRKEIEKLRDALRPFANMSECIENDKDFHIDGDCWIKAKEVLSEK